MTACSASTFQHHSQPRNLIFKILSTNNIMVINDHHYLDNEGIHRVGTELGDGEPGVGAVGVDGPHRGTSELLTIVLVNHLGGDRHDEV